MPAVTERSVALTGHDQYLFREGTHSRLYEKLGAHFLGEETHFAVWAPNAQSVSVVGDWNGWDPRTNPMRYVPKYGTPSPITVYPSQRQIAGIAANGAA